VGKEARPVCRSLTPGTDERQQRETGDVMVRVVHGDERATVYAEGGIGFEFRMPGYRGCWFVCEPSEFIYRLALAVRAEAFPHLAPLPGQPVLVWAVVG
jgi:hypothetical protein